MRIDWHLAAAGGLDGQLLHTESTYNVRVENIIPKPQTVNVNPRHNAADILWKAKCRITMRLLELKPRSKI